MAGKATASVTFNLENADELIAVIREINGAVSGGSGGSVGGAPGPVSAPGSPAGVRSAAPPAMPPPPMTPAASNVGGQPHALPQNNPSLPATAATGSMMFGYHDGTRATPLAYDPMAGRFFDPSTGSYMLQGGWPGSGGGGGKAAPPAPAGGMAGFAGTMAAMGVGQQLQAAASQAAGGWATAQVSGTPYHAVQSLPGLTTVGTIAAGAAIGGLATSWSGPGMLVGAGVGAIVGAVGGDAMKPFIERYVNEDKLRRFGFYMENMDFRGDFGGGKPDFFGGTLDADMIERQISDISQGRYLETEVYRQAKRSFSTDPLSRQMFLTQYGRARYTPGALRKYGLPRSGGDLPNAAELLYESSYGNELEAAGALTGLGDFPAAAMMEAQFVNRTALEGQQTAQSAKAGLAASRFGRAMRYGGPSAARSYGGEYVARSSKLASLQRMQADMIEGTDPYKAEALRAQADQMLEEAEATFADTMYGGMMEESSSRYGLARGRAGRAFDTALYSGAPAASLPYGQRSAAATSRANELEGLMQQRKSEGRLSPAEEMRMREEIEGLRHEASFRIPMEREGRINSERVANTALASSRAMAGAAEGGLFRGSAIEQTSQFGIQQDALDRQLSTLQEILATSKYLTNEQRIQYETQINNLKVERERLEVSKAVATAAAGYMTTETGNIESSVSPSIALIRGAGGAEAGAANLALVKTTRSNVSAKQAQIQELLDSGLDYDHPEVQKARRELAGMSIQLEQQRRGLAVVPMSAQDRAARSTYETQGAFMSAGYGSFGDVRGNLLNQIRMVESRIDELGANRTKMMEAGEWSDAMQADYVEARNAEALRGLGLAQQYSEGWDQRLISQVYNMPASGRLMMSRFTRREAAASGVFHRAFGGSEQQTREMREMYPRMFRAFGSGDPGNFADRAIGGERRVTVDVNLEIRDPSNLLMKNSHQVNNAKTAGEFNVNVNSHSRPGG